MDYKRFNVEVTSDNWKELDLHIGQEILVITRDAEVLTTIEDIEDFDYTGLLSINANDDLDDGGNTWIDFEIHEAWIAGGKPDDF